MTRMRPKYHFTPVKGWMNDPHGLYFDGTEYHLFFQYVENSLKWDKTIAWGHAISQDLLNWTQIENAIEPLDTEAGCWSGSVVLKDGVPHLFYTSPEMSEWANGSVVLALPEPGTNQWVRVPENPLVDRPTDLNIGDFRDPQIRVTETGWKMLMAAGTKSGHGAIVEYESSDLVRWQRIGILADVSSGIGEPEPSSTVWECPQLFEIDGHWVLVISAMDDTGHLGVRYAVGNYENNKFEPTYWGDFSNGGEIYATSLFFNAAGKPGLISWFKEINDTPPAGSEWTGAQTLPVEIELVNHRLRTKAPAAIEFPQLVPTQVVTETWAGAVSGTEWDLEIAGENKWRISLFAGLLTVESHNPQIIHVGTSKEFKILVDTDICEIFTNAGEGAIAFRCPPNSTAELILR